MPTVKEWVTKVNNLSDETTSTDIVVDWLNNAIAKVNAEAVANFPFLTATNLDDTPAFPEKWQYLLLLPYATARIKQMDSSQFEYGDLFAEFNRNLSSFISSYAIPEEYKDTAAATGTVTQEIIYSIEGVTTSWLDKI